jgi:hypothetical protein
MFDRAGSIHAHGIFATKMNSTAFDIKFADVLTCRFVN